MGDEDKLYVPKELVQTYRELCLPLASVLTPNQFELELLTEKKMNSPQDIFDGCATIHERGVPTVVRPNAVF